jgi:hypothetical protein
MTRRATLSPIDPSITLALNPVVELQPGQHQLVPVSVESVEGFRDLQTKIWDVQDEDSLASAFKILAERVHPLALGDVARDRVLSRSMQCQAFFTFFVSHFTFHARYWRVASRLAFLRRNPRQCCGLGMAYFWDLHGISLATTVTMADADAWPLIGQKLPAACRSPRPRLKHHSAIILASPPGYST